MNTNPNIEKAAQRLREAQQTGKTCAPIRDLIGITDLEAAYKVQEINTAKRLAQRARVVGSKIGLTSLVVQKQLGVDQPDFGMLWEDTEIPSGGKVSMQSLMQPKAEAEIAFVLGKDLDADTITTTDILSAIDYAVPSIEIVGSRISNWDIKITDTIADNASASHWVIGNKPVKLENLDLINCKMTMKNNGKVVSEGVGEACLGSPINAVLWLAQKMKQIGSPMQAGDVILSGALGPMVSAQVGDNFSVSIEGLGEVSVGFID